MYKALLFFLICGMSCRQPLVEREVEIHGKDTVKILKTFYPNSNPESVLRYKNGVLHGECDMYYESGNLKQSKTFFEGNEYGNFIKYSPYKVLTEYSFLIDSIHSPYIITFDHGKFSSVKGDPLVDYSSFVNKRQDTLEVRYMFSTFFTKKLIVTMSEDGKLYAPLQLQSNPLFKDVSTGYYKKNIANTNDFSFYFQMEVIYEDGKNQTYYDSIFLHRKKS